MEGEESLKRWHAWCRWGARAPVEEREAENTEDQQQHAQNTTQSQLKGKNSIPLSFRKSELKTLACVHITLGWENMLRSTEEVHYRKISLLEKCICKEMQKRPGYNAMLLHGSPLPGLCLPLPPCTAPAHISGPFQGLSSIYLSTSFWRAHPEQDCHASYYYHHSLETRGVDDFLFISRVCHFENIFLTSH